MKIDDFKRDWKKSYLLLFNIDIRTFGEDAKIKLDKDTILRDVDNSVEPAAVAYLRITIIHNQDFQYRGQEIIGTFNDLIIDKMDMIPSDDDYSRFEYFHNIDSDATITRIEHVIKTNKDKCYSVYDMSVAILLTQFMLKAHGPSLIAVVYHFAQAIFDPCRKLPHLVDSL